MKSSRVPQNATEGPDNSVSLSELGVGVPATLDRAMLPDKDVAFLAALGLYSECKLCVRRHGCACIVEVDSVRVAMAAGVARRILVKPVEASRGDD